MRHSNFQQNISLASLTTFKIGGPARYFYEAKSEDALIEALLLAKKQGLTIFVLGGGSNILVSDQGFDGLVIKLSNNKFRVQETSNKRQATRDKQQETRIEAQAGAPLAVLVKESVVAGLTGLEWAAGIPGTIGGAVRGNTGAFGSQISDLVSHLRVFSEGAISQYDAEAGKEEHGIKSKKECGFAYRESIFKHNQEIILSVDLVLKKGDRTKSQAMIKDYLSQRQPAEPSAGSIFKNIQLSSRDRSRPVPTELATVISVDKIKNGKIPAGYLIEQCGLKGKQIGQAQISLKHANWIVNLGRAKAVDVKALIDLTKQKVKEKFNLDLEEEIGYVGFQT